MTMDAAAGGILSKFAPAEDVKPCDCIRIPLSFFCVPKRHTYIINNNGEHGGYPIYANTVQDPEGCEEVKNRVAEDVEGFLQ